MPGFPMSAPMLILEQLTEKIRPECGKISTCLLKSIQTSCIYQTEKCLKADGQKLEHFPYVGRHSCECRLPHLLLPRHYRTPTH
jgi:hypothetical protein